jgi:hypothetical protein
VFGRHYEVRLDGGLLTEYRPRGFGEGGSAEMRGRLYELRRKGGRRYFLTRDGTTVAWAERARWGTRWTLAFDDAYHVLERESLFRSATSMVLTRDGVRLGSVRRRTSWRGTVEGELSPEMTPPIQLFVVLVAMAIWGRDDQARKRMFDD